MNLILLSENDFTNKTHIRLRGRRFTHVMDIHRASVGDTLCVGLQNGKIGEGKITALNSKELEMEIKLTTPPPSPLPLTIILAMPRPKVFRRVLLNATSMGVKKIIIINAYRVEKSFWQSPVLQAENINRQIILGLEQAKDTILPEIQLKKRFKPFVEDELSSIIIGTRAIVAHPKGDNPCPHEVKTEITLAVGPEGGFIPYEVEKLIEYGFEAVHMGERILRVEAAVPALISKLF